MPKKIPPQPLPPIDANQRYEISTSLRYLRTSRAQFYRAVRDRQIKILKAGRRSYVHGSELIRVSQLST